MRIDEDERRKLVKKFGERMVEEVEKDMDLMSPDARALSHMDPNIRVWIDDDGLNVHSEKVDHTFTFVPENETQRKAIQWITHPRAIGDGISEDDWKEIGEMAILIYFWIPKIMIMSVDRPDLYKSLLSEYTRVMIRCLLRNHESHENSNGRGERG